MKLILAFDPLDKRFSEQDLCYEDLEYWCENPKTDIHPAYVVTESRDLAGKREIEIPKSFKKYSPLRILSAEAGPRKKQAEALIKLAETQKAEMIALVSQGESTLKAQLLGGFAESLLLQSDRPLLFVGRQSLVKNRENRILFATDFSDSSARAFSHLLKQTRSMNPEILIFHAIALPQFASAGPIYAQALNLLPNQYWLEQKQAAEREAEKFVALAQEVGMKTRVVIENQVLSVDRSIKEVASAENVRLVALASVSSSLQRFLAGSISRSILRNEFIRPVWICGPQCLGPES